MIRIKLHIVYNIENEFFLTVRILEYVLRLGIFFEFKYVLYINYNVVLKLGNSDTSDLYSLNLRVIGLSSALG